MLRQTAAHLKKSGVTYEIIVANDGSKDETTNQAIKTADELDLNLVVL